MADAESNEDQVVLDDASDTEVQVEDGSNTPVDDAIADLRRQLERERAARIEADKRAQAAAVEAFSARNDVEDSNLRLIETAIDTVERDNGILKAEYQRALATQDFSRAAEITEAMQQNTVKLQQLQNGRDALRSKPREVIPAPRSADPVEAFASHLTPQSADWVRAHPEYVRDQRLNRRMIAAHELAVTEGIQPDTTEYFETIERTLGIRKRQQAGNPDDTAAKVVRQRDSAPAAAPVSRETGARSNVVRLTPAEREIAELSGLTPEQYAKQKLALQREGKIGS
jgi:hypothetical protein